MKALVKIGILIEFILGFTMMFFLWILGLILSPVSLGNVVTGRQPDHIVLLLLVFLGGLGLLGICQLTIKLVVPSFRLKDARRIKLFLIAGLSALCFWGYSTTISSVEYAAIIFFTSYCHSAFFLFRSRVFVGQQLTKHCSGQAAECGVNFHMKILVIPLLFLLVSEVQANTEFLKFLEQTIEMRKCPDLASTCILARVVNKEVVRKPGVDLPVIYGELVTFRVLEYLRGKGPEPIIIEIYQREENCVHSFVPDYVYTIGVIIGDGGIYKLSECIINGPHGR